VFDVLFLPLVLSFVLLGIHSYFGIEIIKRGIIFTDLAVGQMSAFGAALSIFLLSGQFLYPISLAFSLVTGLLIAFASKRNLHLEAFIALLYALGVSAVFILLSKSPHGTEEFQNLMASDIIFTPHEAIIKTAIIYLLLGFFIIFFNKKTSGFLKDILFFITFSLTVTSSVKLAGVLVVFSLLISPALISITLFKKNQIIYSWIIGILINISSIYISYNFDLPTGYTLVFIHCFLAAIFSLIFSKKNILEVID
jgi:zinc/manganese transport system permease protein